MANPKSLNPVLGMVKSSKGIDQHSKTLFGLVDVNNFFVSCERLFMPRLEGKPVVVLSNNDGCVIARSNEAKALDIAMGEPFFKIKPLVERYKVEVFSSNFSLYGDMSERVMSVIQESVPTSEIYSVDEAFLDLTGFDPQMLPQFARNLVKKIYDWLGLPVSLGIGPTKTLAKVANRVAKKVKSTEGVFGLWDEPETQKILSKMPVGDVWGVGRRYAARLNSMGIHTAEQLRLQDNTWVQKTFNRGLAQTVLELKGIPCFYMEENDPARQRIMVSRSFSKKVKDFVILKRAVARHVTRAAEKLREQGSLAQAMMVFIRTSRFTTPENLYENSCMVPFETATENTSTLIQYATQGLSELYRPGYHYQKVGVILIDLVDAESHIQDIFSIHQDKHSKKLMDVLDEVNATWGSGTLRTAEEGFDHPWLRTNGRRTPAYTTQWDELVGVK